MSKFGSKENILDAINAHFQNIQTGQLTAENMESLVELTRELHERALILRYKTYEEKIFGVREQPTEASIILDEPMKTREEMVKETVEETPEEIVPFERVEEEILNHESTIESNEPVFDFDLFEQAETPTPSVASEPDIEAEIALFPTETFETKIETEEQPVLFEQVEEEILRHETELQEKTVVEGIIHEINNHPTFEEQVFETKIEPTFEMPEESQAPIQSASFVEQTVRAENPAPIQAENTEVFNQLLNTDQSIGSRIKLQTLIGSFGLNEKLQCIRELFHGSSEAFNAALETIDQQTDFNSAKRVMASYAKQYNWSFESSLTAQFVQKVERRFL